MFWILGIHTDRINAVVSLKENMTIYSHRIAFILPAHAWDTKYHYTTTEFYYIWGFVLNIKRESRGEGWRFFTKEHKNVLLIVAHKCLNGMYVNEFAKLKLACWIICMHMAEQ